MIRSEKKSEPRMPEQDRIVHYDLRRCDFSNGPHSLRFATWTAGWGGGARGRKEGRIGLAFACSKDFETLAQVSSPGLAEHCDTMNY